MITDGNFEGGIETELALALRLRGQPRRSDLKLIVRAAPKVFVGKLSPEQGLRGNELSLKLVELGVRTGECGIG